MEELQKKIDDLSRKMDIIIIGLEKMNVHIDFVEDVYDNVRHPFKRLTGIFVRFVDVARCC